MAKIKGKRIIDLVKIKFPMDILVFHHGQLYTIGKTFGGFSVFQPRMSTENDIFWSHYSCNLKSIRKAKQIIKSLKPV